MSSWVRIKSEWLPDSNKYIKSIIPQAILFLTLSPYNFKYSIFYADDEKNNGEVKPEVYMISDQGQSLEKYNLFQ